MGVIAGVTALTEGLFPNTAGTSDVDPEADFRVVTGKPAAYQLVKTRGGFRVLDKPLTTEAYGIAVRKDEPQLKAAFNTALAKIKADGTYAAIVKKWFGATAQ